MIESSNSGQTLSTDDDYVLHEGTTVSAKREDAITVNGVAPVTFTNAGTITNDDDRLAQVRINDPTSALRFNVDSTLVNQPTGDIFGDDIGVFMAGNGINSITNYGDIGSKKGPAIKFGSQSSGTIDNYGTLNNGNVQLTTATSRGIGIDTSGTVTINNHAGASLQSGRGPSSNAITISSGAHFITNDGLIEAPRLGIEVTGGSAQITNRGTIISGARTAISLRSSGNLLTLGTGSILEGDAESSGEDNRLRLQGSGIEDSRLTGFADLTMAGTAWTLSGEVSTTGRVANTIHVQTGTLTVTGELTTGLGGGATIASGAGLAIGSGGTSGSFTGDIVDNGVLTLQRSDAVTFRNLVSGTGSVEKFGAGTTTLDGANSYSGGTRIGDGVLSVSSDTNLGNPAGGLTFFGGTLRTPDAFTSARAISVGGAGGTIDVAGSSATLTGLISGAASLVKTGQRVLTLTADSTGYTGPLTIQAGTVSLGAGGATGTIAGNVINSGQLTFNRVTDLAFGGSIAGIGNIVKQGSNRLTLSGTVSSTRAAPNAIDIQAGVLTVTGTLGTEDDGGTTVRSGTTLAIGNGGSTGDLVGDVVNLGAVVFDRANDLVYRESIVGPGTVAKQGAGTLTLLGNVASTGGITIGGGALRLGDGGDRGATVGTIVNNSALIFDRSNLYIHGSAIGGSGSVTQQGTGTTRLTATNSYTGLTSVNAGRLDVSGIVTGPAQVAANATLGGTGRVSGAVTVATGGHLAPGDSVGTLTVGSLVLNSGSQLDYDLGLPDIVDSGVNDLLIVAGPLTLDGVLNVSDIGGFSQGVYQLIDYGGALTDNGLVIGTLPERFRTGGNFSISIATPGEVNLVVSTGGFGLQYWDGPYGFANGQVDGGTGVWNPFHSNWTNDEGSFNTFWAGGFAVFQGAPGTVTLGGFMPVEGMQFRSDGYVIQDGGYYLAAGPETILNVDAGVTATIAARIADGFSGRATLIKEGAGTLLLGPNNSYSGGTVIRAGRLSVDEDAELGQAGPTGGLTFDGGTLSVRHDFHTFRAVRLDPGGGTIEAFGSPSTFSGVISGPGALTKSGSSELVLSGPGNSYAGGTFVNAGSVRVATNSLLGAPSGVTLDGGGLNVGGGFTSARTITLEVGGGTLDTYGGVATFTGLITGTGGLTKGASPNTIILTGDNDYGVGTTIRGGALQLGNGGTTGSILGPVLDNGTLIFNRSGAYQVANNIDGSGGIQITGGGTAELVGNNNFEGERRIAGGSTLIAALRENLGISGGGSTFMTLDSTLVLTSSFSLTGPFTVLDSTQTVVTGGETTSTTISGQVTGAGLLRKAGTGTLNLTGGANDYAGGTRIDEGTLNVLTDTNLGAATGGLAFDGGTLSLGNTFASARTVTLDAGGGTIHTVAGSTLGGTISGAGALTKTGAGVLVLSGAGNSHSGGTFVNAGSLAVASDNLLGDPAGRLTLDGGALDVAGGFTSARALTLGDGGGALFTNGPSATFSGIISGPGALTKLGSTGTIILSRDNDYAGGTTIGGGVLQIGDGGATGNILGDVVNQGDLTFNRSDAYAIANTITGTGSVTIDGGGIATPTGSNAYTGETRIFGLVVPSLDPPIGSSLVAVANSNLGSATGTIVLGRGGKLVLADSFEVTRSIVLDGTASTAIDTQDNTVTASGVISGSAPLIKDGIGTLTITNTNSQTGNVFINAGTLEIGGDAGTGTLNGNVAIAANARLVFNHANAIVIGGFADAGDARTFGRVISGEGAVVQAGAGTLTAVGAHTYTGGTFVESGGLFVDGTLVGPARVASGATLGGSGAIGGAVTIADGGHLAPGTSVGALTLGSLDLGAGSFLEYELGLPGIVDSGVNDLVVVGGALTLDGTLDIIDTGGFSQGVYRLINYGGALTDNGLLIGGLPARFVAGDMLISTATPGEVDLIVSSGGFGLQFWDGAGTLGNGAIEGGTATWTNTTANWTAADGVVNAPWQRGFAVFQGAAGTVMLGEPIALEGMQFRTNGYLVEGGGLGLAAAPATIIRVDPTVTATISAPIADGAGGASLLTKSDDGLLVLGGTNSYTGGTLVEGGALQVGADSNLGAASGALGLNKGALITTASFATGRTVALGWNGGTFSPAAGTQLTLAGTVGGAGLLAKTGTGTLVLSGTNSYAGGTSIGAGVLAVASDSNLGSVAGLLNFAGGTLRFDASFNPTASRAVSLDGPGGTIDTNGHDAAFAQGMVGTGALTKIGTGTLTLTGSNAYSGGTTIAAGTLQIGDGGTTGGITGDVVDNAGLTFNRPDAVTFAGAISGSGSLTKLGAGTLVLTGASSHAGGTTIGGGTLQVGEGTTTGSLAGNVVDNGALVFDRADTVSFGGVVSGSGTLSQIGGGTLALGGVNSHTGGTIGSAGTIAVSSDLNLGASGAVLTLGGGTLLTTAALASSRPIALAIGGGTIDNGGFADLFAGKLTGIGAFAVTGSGTVTLSADNDYAGGTTIAAGTLRIGDGGATGDITGTVVNNAVLTFARSNFFLFDGMVSGGGSVVQAGTGTTILTASNSYTGGTSINSGALQIGNGGVSGSIAGDVANSSLLAFDRSDVLAFAGVISGAGSVTQAGAGATVLTGTSSYTGGTTIAAGTLQIGDGGTAGSITGNVANDSALVFDRADGVAFAGTISGAGTLRQAGAGVLTLSAINSHGGGTNVSAGTLSVSMDANIGAANALLTLDGGRLLTTAGIDSLRPIRLAAGGGTIDNGGFASLFSGPTTGAGALVVAGAGTVTLSADTTHTGGTTIAAGVLRLGEGGASGSVVGDVVNAGTLVFDRSNALVFDGVISGAGGVVQQGTGTTTLTAMSSYAGPTSVAQGRLLVDGAIGGGATVASGARLGGTGTIAGTVTVADGGHLAPGQSAGTLTVGSLMLGAGALLDYEFSLPDVVGGDANDLTIVTGALTLDGSLNLADAGGLSRGVYRIISYGGALTDNGLVLASLPTRFLANDMLISTATAGEVNLIVSPVSSFGLEFWDGPNTLGNGAVDGGSATWNAATTNWTAVDGSVNAPWRGGFAVFQGSAGTVTLGAPIAFEGLQFRTHGYVIDGGSFALTAAPDTIVRVDPAVTATIAAPITGPATLTKTGTGTLVLAGANSYSGGTSIEGGALQVGADAALGAPGGALGLNAGTLVTTASFASTRAVTLAENDGTFATAAGTQLTLGGPITGPGALAKTGAGTLVLTGANSYSGGTRVAAGVLAVSADSHLGAATAPLLLDGGSLRFEASFDPAATRPVSLGSTGGTIDTGGHTATFAQGLTGTGALTKTGTGTLILAGANVHSGTTTIATGTLQIGHGGTTGSLAGNVVDNASLVFNRSDQASYDGTISGTGSLTQAGTGTTVLTAANSYTGGTSIQAGTLQIGNGGTTGSLTGNIVNNGTLAFDRTDTLTYAGTISGAGAVRQEGSGTLTLTGANSYSGGTTIGAGTLQIGAGGTSGSVAGPILDNGALTFNRSDAVTFAGVVSGTGTLAQVGPSILTLSGSNAHTGGTIVRTGTLAVASDLNVGAASAALTLDGGRLLTTAAIASARPVSLAAGGGTIDNGGFADLFSGPFTGPGALTVTGAGSVTLAADNSYTGGTTIAAGTLRLGNGGTTGSVTGTVANNGTLVFDRANALVFDGAIGGSGAVTQQGTGTTTLTAASGYAGPTSVAQGRLLVDGSIAGAATVASGARLGGTGTIAGTVTVADGGHLAPGQSAGTLTVGSLMLGAGALLDYEFALPGVVGGGVNDLTIVTGALTLDGSLNLADAGGFSQGVYRIIDYGGALTDNGLVLGTLPTRFITGDMLISTSTPGQVNLIVSSGGFALQFWDGPNTLGNGAADGGSATWNTATTNWTSPDGSLNAPWQGGFAVFEGSAGTVTLGAPIAFEGLQVRTTGYRIEGGGFALAAAPDTIVRVDPAVTATLNAPIADGPGGATLLTKTGAGTLVLGGANSYSGGTSVTGGTLQVAADAGLGTSTGALGLNAGTLATTASFASARAVTLAENGGTFATAAGTQLTLVGAIAGAGQLAKTGAGTLILAGANTYSGGTSIAAGVLAVSADAHLGGPAGPLDFAGGTLRFDASFNPTASRAVSLADPGGTIDTNGHNATLAQALAGTGALTKIGAGTLTLAGSNSYTGTTTIAAGTLQVGEGATTGSLSGTIVDNAGLAFNRSDAATFAGAISGIGSLTKLGTGTLTLTGAVSHTGGTTIAAGTLQIGAGATTGSLAGAVLDNGALLFDRSDAVTFGGAISGTGTLAQIGTGTLTLAAVNSHTGGTSIQAGTIAVAADASLGAAGAVLTIDGATLLTSAAIASARPVSLAAGGGTIDNGGFADLFSGPLTGPGALTVTGAGSVALAADNSYAGGTTIAAGTLRIGQGGTTGSIAGDVADNGTLLFDRSDRLAFGGMISGSGSLVQAGLGTIVLTGASRHTGGTTIAAGVLRLGEGGASGSVVGDVVNAGTLVFDRSNALVFDGVISGAGGVVQQGTGTTTLTAMSSYAGPTSVAQGRLLVDGAIGGGATVASGARLGGTGTIAGTVTVADGGHLAPGQSAGTLTVGSLMLGAGALLDYEFSLPDVVGGDANDLTIVTGALTLDGSLNLADAGGLSRGVYRIISYGGALTDNGLVLASLPTRFLANDMLISTATAGEVNLIVSPVSSFGLEFWDGPNTLGNGAVDGGSATWNAATTNWTAVDGSVNAPWRGGFAVFQGSAGTVTLGAPIAFEGLQFRTHGYVIDGGSFALTAAPDTIVRVDPAVTATIAAPITGPATLTKTGTGTLVLAGANSYSGGTSIEGGALQVGADAALGAPGGALGLNAGTLVTTASFASTRAVTLAENDGTFATAAGTQLTLGGPITGPGALAKTGAGTLVLTGANSYSGGTRVAAGVLAVSADSHLGAATAPLLLDGGSLRFEASFDPAATRPVSLGSTGGTIDTGGHTATFAQGLTGTGALTKTGTGTLILAGANVHSGTTTIATGTLQIGHGGTTGSLAGNVVDNASLVFNRSDQASYDGTISGTGSLTQAGTGTTVLTAANSYTGGTSIQAGTLQIGNGGTTGSLTGNIVNNGTLAFDRTDTLTYAGTISGAGAVRQEGSGTLTLTGANSYSGGTTIVRGRVETAGSLASMAVSVGSGATLSGGGSIAGAVRVADGARFAPGPLDTPGTLSVGALNFAPDGQLDWRLGQPLLFRAPSGSGSPLNDLARVAGDLILDGTLNITPTSSSATLPGSYRLIEYGGALTDNGLVLGSLPTRFAASVVQTAIPGQVNLIAVRDELAVQFWDGSDGLGNGQVNGGTGTWTTAAANWTGSTGAINQQWLSGMAIFTAPGGQVTLGEDVDAIALQFAGDGYRIAGAGHALTLLSHGSGFGGLVRVDPAATAEIAAVIAGTAGLTKADSGTLILTGENSYSGGTAIRGGTLQIGARGTTGSIGGDVEDDGRLAFNRSDNITFAGAISGLGSVDQHGNGILTLTGANSYSGGTNVLAGTLQIARDANIGAATGALLVDSARLRWAAAFDLAPTRPITLGAGGATFDTNAFNSTISQRIGGPGGLIKTGAGRLVLAGDSDYAGPTAIDAGELAVIGSIRSSTTVGPNGLLSGTGRINANVLNRGLITPGNSIGTLTVAGNYSGAGGALEIEAILGSDNSPSDRLVIVGGAASGATTVRVLNLGGEGDLTTGDGILVVDATAGGTTAANAFALAGPLLAGPYEYQLQRGGTTGSAADDWFLRSTLEDETPSYRPETSLYATLPSLALTYGRSLIGTLDERVGDIGAKRADPGDRGALWSRVLGRDGHREGRNGIQGEGPRYDYDFYAFQLGADVIRNVGDSGDDFAGVYGAYGSGRGNVQHFTLARAGKDEFDAYSLGAYWTHLWSTGWYLDGVVQGTLYELEANSPRLPKLKTDGFGFAASIEGGRSLQSGGVTIEPQAQLVFQTASLDRAADVVAQVRFEGIESLAGRIGARVAKTWGGGEQDAVTLWARANLWYEFMGDTKSEFSSAAGFIPLHADLGGEWVELDAGITAKVASNVSVHGTVTYETDFGNEQRGLEAQLGIRIAW